MITNHRAGFYTNPKFIVMFMLLFTFLSCERDEPMNSKGQPKKDLEKHLQYLEDSGFDRQTIVYNEMTDEFTIDNDLLISRTGVEGYMKRGNPQGRTEQRRWQWLLSDTYVTNFKYAIPSNIPASWRTAIQQAISQWNGVGGSRLRMSEVSSGANITVSISYDAVNNWVARASMPLSNGAPGPTLEINSFHNNMADGQKLFAMVHEMGHNIGLLHTNQTDGAVIPGTPVTDANSVMNSFVLPWNGFTEFDRVAVRTLYPGGTSFSQTIEAENYAAMSGVIKEACSEGGQNVGSFDAGNWTSYNVNIPSAGTYRVSYRVASIYSGRSLRLERANGTVNLGTIGIPHTGGWQSWTSINHTVTLPAGSYSIGIATSTGGFNINRFHLAKL
jgi:hypothetical protein